MRSNYLLLLIVLGLLSSCGGDDTADVNVNFRLVNDGEPIAAFDQWEYPLGYDIFLTKYSFFISALSVKNEDGESETLLDYEWMDLLAEQIDAESALVGKTFTVADFPIGNYTELSINLGVDESTNAMSPADFSTNHPLGNTGEYWAGWESYIFHKMEGKIDSDGDGMFEKNVALHIGSNSAFRSKTEARNITISEDGDNTITFEIDLRDIINIDGSVFDLDKMPQIHSEAVLPNVLPLMDNLIEEL